MHVGVYCKRGFCRLGIFVLFAMWKGLNIMFILIIFFQCLFIGIIKQKWREKNPLSVRCKNYACVFKLEMTLIKKMSKIEWITMNEIPMKCIDFYQLQESNLCASNKRRNICIVLWPQNLHSHSFLRNFIAPPIYFSL